MSKVITPSLENMFELIAAEDLRRRLSRGTEIGIIDARRTDAFKAGHIPGAINLLWEEWCEDAPASASAILHQPGWWGRLEDVSPAELERKLSALGFASDREIVVYADGAKSKGRDGRIAWMLLYFGAKNVSILNGGLDAWISGGIASSDAEVSGDRGEVDMRSNHLQKSSFVVDFDSQRRIELKDLVGSKVTRGVDTRTREEHHGEIYVYQPRLGRIPNSVNIPFSTLYKSDGKFLDQDEFLNELRSNRVAFEDEGKVRAFEASEGGAREGEAIHLRYSYCEVGVRLQHFLCSMNCTPETYCLSSTVHSWNGVTISIFQSNETSETRRL